MCYKKAKGILPKEIIEIIQEYVDGEYIYIPRKENSRKEWGSNTSIREEIRQRNLLIYEDYTNGLKTRELTRKYFLSDKSIQRIIKEEKVRASAN